MIENEGSNFDRQIDRQTDYLSKENSDCLKGIFAVCVLLHHLYQHSGLLRNGVFYYLGFVFQSFGYVSVAVFFFLSGYGLMFSYRKNPDLSRFPHQKILPFYLIIVFLTIFYWGLNCLAGNMVSLSSVVQSLTFGGTVIANGWYLQAQLLYYIFYFFIFQFVCEKWQLPVMAIAHLLYMVLCISFGLSNIYYERTFIFVFGMLWCMKKNAIDSWLSNRTHYLLSLVLSFLLFASFYLAPSASDKVPAVAARGISYFFFISAVMLLTMKIKVCNVITRFLGTISLEIYVTQGALMMLFHSNILYISNPYLYVAAVIICTFALSLLLHPMFRWIYRICRTQTKPDVV